MSRVAANHIFLLASKPEHPLAPSGLKDWMVERTVLQPEDWTTDRDGYIDNITFVHYVSPPLLLVCVNCGVKLTKAIGSLTLSKTGNPGSSFCWASDDSFHHVG